MAEAYVWITNPDIPGTERQRTTQQAFDNVWSGLGWEIIPYDPEAVDAVEPNLLTDANRPFLLDRANHIGLDTPATPAPSTEVAYAQITADITGIVIDTLNLDLISCLAVTIGDLNVPVWIEGRIVVSHSVANATVNPVICKTSPAPTTILNSAGQFGFAALSAIGSKAIAAPTVRLPANSPGTYQLYLAGTGGTAAVNAQTYSPCWIRAWTV